MTSALAGGVGDMNVGGGRSSSEVPPKAPSISGKLGGLAHAKTANINTSDGYNQSPPLRWVTSEPFPPLDAFFWDILEAE